MWRFIFLVLILIVSVLVGLKIAEDPGYAIFAYKHWTMEMPLWFAVVSVIVGLLLFYLILRFLNGIDVVWSNWKNWLRLRRKHKSYSKTNRGLIELIEANWKKAENFLMEGVDQSDAPLINFLAAAKAAHEQGLYDKRDIYLRKAYDLSPQTHTAVGLMQAQLQLQQGKYEQALATLNHLRQDSPKQPLVLKLLERIYIHLGDWRHLLKLIPDLRKARVISLEQMGMLESKVYQELLKSTRKNTTPIELNKVWESIPGKLQKNSDVVCCYVQELIRYPNTSNEIEELIARTIKRGWHAELVRLYGLLNTDNATKQLKTAEYWEKQFGPEAILFLTLARLNVRCQIWGKAKHYFEESLKCEERAETYRDYGNLLQQLQDTNAALRIYQKGLTESVA